MFTEDTCVGKGRSILVDAGSRNCESVKGGSCLGAQVLVDPNGQDDVGCRMRL